MKLVTLFIALLATIAINAAGEDSRIASLRGVSRFLAQQNQMANMTCDKFPRVCRLKSSPGPDCCKKKCVNVKTDRLSCGMCVNASFDQRNCGGCNKKCNKGELCVYGMCNYA